MVLIVLYWLLIILALIGFYPIPEPWPRYIRGIDLILFIIIGIKLFGLPS